MIEGAALEGLPWLTYGLDELGPAGVRVQPPGPHERAPVGSWEIPFDRVVSVVPERREVTVADPGAPAIERAGRGTPWAAACVRP